MSSAQLTDYDQPITGQLTCTQSGQGYSWALNRYVGPDESRKLSEEELLDLVSRISMTGFQCKCSHRSGKLHKSHALFTGPWVESTLGTDLMRSTPEETLEALCSSHSKPGYEPLRVYSANKKMYHRARRVLPKGQAVPESTLIAVDERMLEPSQAFSGAGLTDRFFLSVTPLQGPTTEKNIQLVTLPIKYTDTEAKSGGLCSKSDTDHLRVFRDDRVNCDLK